MSKSTIPEMQLEPDLEEADSDRFMIEFCETLSVISEEHPNRPGMTKENPTQKASWISKLFLSWLNDIFRLVSINGELLLDDLPDTLPEDSSFILTKKLEKEWKKEVIETDKKNQELAEKGIVRASPSLVKCIWRAFKWEILWPGLILTLADSLRVTQPILLRFLIGYFQDDSTTTLNEAVCYAVGIVVTCIFYSITTQKAELANELSGMQIRIAVSGLLYKKSLRLENSAFKDTTTGQIMSLLSTDATKLDHPTKFLHYFWIGPIESLTVLIILYMSLGASPIIAFMLVIVLIPFQVWFGKFYALMRGKVAVKADERVRLTNEAVAGMRLVKMNCWETSFLERIKEIRDKETTWIVLYSVVKGINMCVNFLELKFAIFIVVIANVLMGLPLRAETIFPAISLFSILQMSVCIYIPKAVETIADAKVSIDRFTKFLLLPEFVRPLSTYPKSAFSSAKGPRKYSEIYSNADFRNEDMKVEKSVSFDDPSVNFVVHMSRFTASWDKEGGDAVLRNINVALKQKQLLAVIGPVAAGKSSLLQGMLGELTPDSGSVRLNGRVAYVSQQAWIFSGTVRQNIVFGKPFDKIRYATAIQSCALTRDLEEFEDGDKTPVGENGCGLSGGQKARVNLARAVFSDADIYLLDDPLSAVDANVSKHLFDRCICGSLADKARVLVTHQTQFLSRADQILVLGTGGKIMAQGSYQELIKQGIDFEDYQNIGKDDSQEEGVAALRRQSIMRRKSLGSRRPSQHRRQSQARPMTSQLRRASMMSDNSGKDLIGQYGYGRKLSSMRNSIIPQDQLQLLQQQQQKQLQYQRGSVASEMSASVSVRRKSMALSNPASYNMSDIFEYGDGNMDEMDRPDIESMDTESVAFRPVGLWIYKEYFGQAAGAFGCFVLILFHVLFQVSYVASDVFLSQWTNHESKIYGDRKEILQALGVNNKTENPAEFFHNILIQRNLNGTIEAMSITRNDDEYEYYDYDDNGTMSASSLSSSSFLSSSSSSSSTSSSSPFNVTLANGTTYEDIYVWLKSVFDDENKQAMDICIYTGIMLAMLLLGLMRSTLHFYICVIASKKLHDKMLDAIFKTSIYFFDTNPIGRILSRFTQDIGWTDDLVPTTSFLSVRLLALSAGNVIIVGYFNPYIFLTIVPLFAFFVFFRSYFLRASRSVRRLEGATRSPILSQLNATLLGLHTIRAYQAQDNFKEDYFRMQDIHTSTWYLFLCVTRWFAMRMELLCSLFIASTCFFCLYAGPDVMEAGTVGLSLAYAFALTGWFQWGIRQTADLENQMISAERCLEYQALPAEACWHAENVRVPKSWPSEGALMLRNVYFAYNRNDRYILKNISINIKSREKIGIVGRTGAGKSSFFQMLFRMAEPLGKVLIDGLDIRELGLHDLRSKIGIIPQDPLIFQGTLRYNLDPFNNYSDYSIWMALEEVQMKAAIEELPNGLETELQESGSNLSVGQRQLLCLARAILQRCNILLVDEATANLDNQTDKLIQQTIRSKFKYCTTLTVAHRLLTVMDSDRILVLDAGCVAEFDKPHLLLSKEKSILKELVDQTGESADELRRMAKRAFEKSMPFPQVTVVSQEEIGRGGGAGGAGGGGDVGGMLGEEKEEEEDDDAKDA